MTSTPDAIRAYASNFHRSLGGHHVASPLGVWLLLALLAPVASGPARVRLESILGTSADEAAAGAKELIENAHPAVGSALAAWGKPGHLTERYEEWRSSLPAGTNAGEVPSQEEADRWTREKTYDLIKSFPLALDERTLLVLASALAAKVSWQEAFTLVPGDELGSPWGREVEQALQSPSSHRSLILETRIGELAVHVAPSEERLSVVSGIGPEGVSSSDVMAALHEVAGELLDWRPVSGKSLFDLDLEGHSWTITERAGRVSAANGREEQITSVLPAWNASSTWDLTENPEAGASEALTAFMGLLDEEKEDVEGEAVQSAVASYTRTGFEAAAVTAFGIRASAMPMFQEGLIREATLRFGRGYGVVAVTHDASWSPTGWVYGPWHAVPVFSAWVEQPTEAE